MDRETKRLWQELITSQMWAQFKVHVYRQKDRTLVDLQASGRAGDGVRCAKFAGQLEMIDLMLNLPENELKRA